MLAEEMEPVICAVSGDLLGFRTFSFPVNNFGLSFTRIVSNSWTKRRFSVAVLADPNAVLASCARSIHSLHLAAGRSASGGANGRPSWFRASVP